MTSRMRTPWQSVLRILIVVLTLGPAAPGWAQGLFDPRDDPDFTATTVILDPFSVTVIPRNRAPLRQYQLTLWLQTDTPGAMTRVERLKPRLIDAYIKSLRRYFARENVGAKPVAKPAPPPTPKSAVDEKIAAYLAREQAQKAGRKPTGTDPISRQIIRRVKAINTKILGAGVVGDVLVKRLVIATP